MGGSCATGHCEPCQAGNRAALSSFSVRRSKSAHSYTQVRNFKFEVKKLAYQALYRKYRPSTFSDVVGQEHITETLKSELSEGKTVHAYLFTGTRGTGKTSCAKILAKAVNCLNPNNGDPCLECEQCKAAANEENTDIVEIDAASNNSVDSIREIIDMIGFTPATSKYRVYIIDEVHMLSISAFNALLKTLEEPPSHVVFVLATTEVHKLPATILSRCQRFDFRRIDSDKICERIQYIAEKEGLTVTDEAATLIAAAADGGMRDALSILDLCASRTKNIDEADVESVCAMAGNDYLLELTDCIKQGNTEKGLLLLSQLNDTSVDMLRLLGELTSHFRDLMIVKTVKSDKKPIVCSKRHLEALTKQAESFDIKEIIYCLDILQKCFPAMQTGNRRCEMEMAIIRLCNPSLSADLASLERRITALERNGALRNRIVQTKESEIAEPEQEASLSEEITEEDLPSIGEGTPKRTVSTADEVTPVAQWQEILSLIKQSCPIMWGVLKNSDAYIKGDYLLIDAKNEQFRSLINGGNSTYKNSIRKAAADVLGVTYKLGPYNKPSVSDQEDPLTAFAEKLKKFEI